jgi:hypothetical protein
VRLLDWNVTFIYILCEKGTSPLPLLLLCFLCLKFFVFLVFLIGKLCLMFIFLIKLYLSNLQHFPFLCLDIELQVKVVKCTVKNIAVDISFNQMAGLYALHFLEQVNLIFAN